MKQENKNDLQTRFIRWFIIAVAGGTILYVGGSIWVGFEEMGEELQNSSGFIFSMPFCLHCSTMGCDL